MKQLIILLFCLGIGPLAFAQGNVELYNKEWEKADSLILNGFPESAAKLAQSIYDRASQKGQQVQMMKAQIFLMSADFQRSEEAYKKAIEKSESNAHTATFPNNAIWQSIAAQLYWSYYQQNRWKILDRTKTNAGSAIEDFEQWDANRFVQKTSELYKASISRAAELEKISIDKYDPILIKGVNSRNLRPTLFDLLAFRALDFFENDEKDVTRAAFAFVLNDEKAFAPAEQFIQAKFATRDTSSLQRETLRIYQRLLTMHMDDASKDALIDADLHRLSFVYNHTTLPNKKSLYQSALEQLAQAHAGNPLSALAAYQAAQLLMRTEHTRIEYVGTDDETPKPSTPYTAIKERLEKIIARYPESEGGILSKQLLQQILTLELSLTAEEVVLPGAPSKVLINYRNTPQAWFRLVRLENSKNKWVGSYRSNGEQLNNEVLKQAAIKQWSEKLPGTQDYDRHSTELKIDALPPGTYAIIVSGKEGFKKEENLLSFTVFQVSSIAAVQGGAQGYALDRKTGRPLAGAEIDFYRQRYNDNIRGYDLVKTTSATADKDGRFKYATGEEASQVIRIRYGKDTVVLAGYFSSYDYKPENKPETQTFFFTDRSIYRPGQTIYFKGIMVRKEDGGKKNNVIANESTEVTFYDVNGQKVSSQKLKTNEFGSFTGHFTAPDGLLNGNMSISNGTGSANFSVEEYKRPKFSVSFDTLKKAYALNDMVSVQGNATAYAGNNIDNATVSYRVVRNARFPYWWYAYRWGYIQSPEMEIANGTVQTDQFGKFKIDFKAIPDEEVNPEALPVFTYTVTADVTDINGETRTGTTTVSVGYTSLQLTIGAPEKAKPVDLANINIRSTNLNDQFVATDVQVKISRLKAPATVLKKRLWAVPDQFIMDSLSFKQSFPNDAYRDEDNHLKWAVEQQVFGKTLKTTKEGNIAVPSDAWNKNGWYVIEVIATDKSGKKLTEKKYLQVWSEQNSGKINEPLLVVPASQTAEPGQQARVQATTGYNELHVIRQVSDMSFNHSISQADITDQPLIWTRQITEADRGGVMVNYITIKENRVYTAQAFVNIPWSNKDLNISWETHRDKLEPGSKETWTMVVRGNRKEKVAAEMVAALYDASLDAFRPHSWSIYSLFPTLYANANWQGVGFGQAVGRGISGINMTATKYYEKRYDQLYGFQTYYGREVYSRGGVKASRMFTPPMMNMKKEPVALQEAAAASPEARDAAVQIAGARTGNTVNIVDGQPKDNKASSPPPIRKNLQETAFFLPQLKTDAEGNIRIGFTMPEALTEWKLLTFAHTRDMSYGMESGTVKTQKDLMVMPNLPRFLRQGDDIVISAKISNLSDHELTGTATLELMNALTMQPVDLPFRLQQKDQSFSAARGQSTTASWKLHVPESMYAPVMVRIYARSGNFTDGEESAIPVVTNRMLVTETLPLWINGNGSKNFSFDKLKYSDSSKTLVQHALTLEYTGNPAWYAAKSLPYLMEYPYECAEQTFNRYYATALAAYIVQQSPQIKAIFDKWKEESMFSSFKSPLQMNEELKSALLQETPWVMEANTESEQRKRLGELFDTYKLSKELDATMKKLKDMQLPDGSFPWFKGMRADRYITQYIVTGLGRLQQLGVKDTKGNMKELIAKALPYLDEEVRHSYDNLVKSKVKLDQQNIGYTEVQYLYMRSFFNDAISNTNKTAVNYYRSQSAKYWSKFNPYMKGMIAIAVHRNNDKETPKAIIQSLKETAIRKEEMGMYWMQPGSSYWWYEAPIEAQALLIECFKEVTNDVASVDAMKVWLLKNKQTQSWETTKATADACYALLLAGTDWLTNEPKVTINLGNKIVKSEEQTREAGSGYFKIRYDGTDVTPSMGDIKVNVTGNNNSTSWGAIYWQYFEDLDRISGAKTPLEIKKQLFIERNTDRGPELNAIKEKDGLKVGDKVTVRIEIIVDRDMEYVHMKDMRASCFEPVNVISSYKWQGGLGYYESTKDVSTNFFFDYLRKGKYVFEYPVFVSQSGNFSNGIATIQCMYAPEFSSHSEGIRVQVAQ